MNTWSGFDFLIFLIFSLNTILGMVRGAMREIMSMICLSVSLIFTIKFTIPVADFCNRSPLIIDVVDNQIMQNFMQAIGAGPLTVTLLNQIFYSISLLICFMLPYSLCEGALSYRGMMEMYTFPFMLWNRKVGGALGCVRGYVISLIVMSILTLHIFTGDYTTSFFSNSFFLNLFHDSTVRFDQLIGEQKPESYREIYQGKDLYKAHEVLENMGTEQLPEGMSAPPVNIPTEQPNPSPTTP